MNNIDIKCQRESLQMLHTFKEKYPSENEQVCL